MTCKRLAPRKLVQLVSDPIELQLLQPEGDSPRSGALESNDLLLGPPLAGMAECREVY